MKIARKLTLSFILVASISAIVGIVGTIYIKNIDKLDSDMYERHTESLPHLANIARIYQRERVLLRDMYMHKSVSDKNSDVSRIREIDTKLKDSMNNFAATIKDAQVQEKFDYLRQKINEFEVFRDEVINYIQTNQMDEAYDLLTGTRATDISDAIQTVTDELMDLKTTLAKNASDSNSNAADTAIVTMITLIVAGIIVSIILASFISNNISKSVNEMVVAAERLAEGDLDVYIKNNSKDEIGILAGALRKMADNLNEVVSNIKGAADQVASGAAQVSNSSIALSRGATEQASSIEELTASLEEISSQTKLNAENANEANKLSEEAKLNASQGNAQMKEMLNAMDEINESSNNISKIIKVIDDIAFQTNILALNAAVEAARAGQHGKGFAVVAEEVRTLAARSANAAKETTEMIESSIKKVEVGTKIAKETADALQNIVSTVDKVANIVSNIAIASNEQATGIEQINQGIMQVSEVVQNNSATSEESAAASEELSSQAALLKDMVSRFKLKQNFKSQMRLDELNPEVLKMLEKMSESKKGSINTDNVINKPVANEIKENKIALNDKEFGKY